MKTSFEHYLRQQGLSKRTVESYRKSTRFLLEWMEKEQLEAIKIRYNDLLLFIKYLQRKGVVQRTIQSYFRGINHYFDYLELEGLISSNPTADIKINGVVRKKLYHVLEPHQLHRLYQEYKAETLATRRNKVMLGLLVYQGVTTAELGKVSIKDVNLREGEVCIPGSRKSNERTMKLEPQQIMELYDYTLQVRPELLQMNPKRKSQEKQETEQLFIGEGGNRYSISNFVTQLMIKVRELQPHIKDAKQIRASVITKWLRQHNLREVQYLAGHRYIGSTESYLQNEMEGLLEEVNQFHPF